MFCGNCTRLSAYTLTPLCMSALLTPIVDLACFVQKVLPTVEETHLSQATVAPAGTAQVEPEHLSHKVTPGPALNWQLHKHQ